MAVQGHAEGPGVTSGHIGPVAFRTDASLEIGTGHVMRCLTLADELAAYGADCSFICADCAGHLADVIRARGHGVHLLPSPSRASSSTEVGSAHAGWLATSWEEDADQVRQVLACRPPSWLVLDHYAIDGRWEQALRHHYGKLLVIDDLADRPHDCDLLLDQNAGRRPADYDELTGSQCRRLIGPQYALLRPEFAAHRDESLRRRHDEKPSRLLVTMGGVDAPNATGTVLDVLKNLPQLPINRIDVVMNAQAPWLTAVCDHAATMPCQTEVHVSPTSMARLMAVSDLAIGAAGTTALERCCLGLPTLQVVLARNQEQGAAALSEMGSALSIGTPQDIAETLPGLLTWILEPRRLAAMSLSASTVTDGQGATRVLEAIGFAS